MNSPLNNRELPPNQNTWSLNHHAGATTWTGDNLCGRGVVLKINSQGKSQIQIHDKPPEGMGLFGRVLLKANGKFHRLRSEGLPTESLHATKEDGVPICFKLTEKNLKEIDRLLEVPLCQFWRACCKTRLNTEREVRKALRRGMAVVNGHRELRSEEFFCFVNLEDLR